MVSFEETRSFILYNSALDHCGKIKLLRFDKPLPLIFLCTYPCVLQDVSTTFLTFNESKHKLFLKLEEKTSLNV